MVTPSAPPPAKPPRPDPTGPRLVRLQQGPLAGAAVEAPPSPGCPWQASRAACLRDPDSGGGGAGESRRPREGARLGSGGGRAAGLFLGG